jgi:hypothetical protein
LETTAEFSFSESDLVAQAVSEKYDLPKEKVNVVTRGNF